MSNDPLKCEVCGADAWRWAPDVDDDIAAWERMGAEGDERASMRASRLRALVA